MADLNTAIQLIRDGQKVEARHILEPLLQTDRKNISAWLWYVATWPDTEKRLQILVACLKFNPGEERILQAIRVIKAQQSGQPLPVQSVTRSATQKTPTQPFYKTEQESTGPAEPKQAINWDELDKDSSVSQSVPMPDPPAVEADPNKQPEASPGRQPYSFYKIWFTAFFNQKLAAYADLLEDPKAEIGRVLEWISYVSILNVVFSLVILGYAFNSVQANPEIQDAFSKVLARFNPTTLMLVIIALIIITPLINVFNLLLNSGIQNLLAKMFRGKGDFRRTVYAIGIFVIPGQVFSILLTIPLILYFVQLLSQPLASLSVNSFFSPYLLCLVPLLILYYLILSIRALRAAHSLGFWSGLGVVFVSMIFLVALSYMFNYISFLLLSPIVRSLLATLPQGLAAY